MSFADGAPSAERLAAMTAAVKEGKILTFYSYKGGVGRSMALANVAALLAGKRQRVLIVDWDLEAPGIEQYFRPYVGKRVERRPGVVDLMQARAKDSELDWRTCLTTATINGGEIHILGAGHGGPVYAVGLSALSWKELFAQHDLGRYLERLRGEWIAAYDFVLIDSRTGITDIGGICTIHLPDVVVALFTSNEQSLTGVVQALRDARRQHAALPVDRSRLLVVPVPSRDESQSEHERSEQWYVRFAVELDEFYRDWLPATVTPAQALDILRIPYKAYWSFGEPLPVIEEGIAKPTSLGYAYALLASLIESGFNWTQVTAGQYVVERPMRTVAAGDPARATGRGRRWVIAAATLSLVLVVVVVVVMMVMVRAPSDRRDPASPKIVLDAGGGASHAEYLRETRLDAARRTEVPLQRALLLREIPASVFPAADVKLLLKGLPVPAAVFRSDTGDSYEDARFDHQGRRLALARRSGAQIVSADGHGPGVTITARSPVGLAVFSADDGHLITGDGAGMTIWDARTGARTGGVQYFTDHPARFVATVDADDRVHTFFQAGGDGDRGTRNAVFAVNAADGKAQRWWDALKPLLAIDHQLGRLLYADSTGAVYAMAQPEKPVPVIPSPGGTVDAAVLAGGYVALTRGNRLSVRSLGLNNGSKDPTDSKTDPGKDVNDAVVPQGRVRDEGTFEFVLDKQGPALVFGPVALSNKHVAAAAGPSVELAVPGAPTLNDRVHPVAGDAAMVAIAGDWLLVGSTEGSVDLWRLGDRGAHVVLIGAQRAKLQRIAFSPSGARALAVWRDGTVRVWPVRPGGVVDDATDAEVLPRLQAATSACLSIDERAVLLRESVTEAGTTSQACLAAAAAASAQP